MNITVKLSTNTKKQTKGPLSTVLHQLWPRLPARNDGHYWRSSARCFTLSPCLYFPPVAYMSSAFLPPHLSLPIICFSHSFFLFSPLSFLEGNLVYIIDGLEPNPKAKMKSSCCRQIPRKQYKNKAST